MKKIILLAGLVAGGVALSGTAFANHWLLYLPAILAGSGGKSEPPTTTETNNWLLFLPAILAGNQGGGTEPPVVTDTGLNDTGITATVGSTGKEDADYGRDADAETNNDNDGHAGFSFTQINSTCVLDNITGLAWEVKTTGDSTASSDKEKKYDWAGATTYAESFTGCGTTYTSCRLPTVNELLSIVSFGASAAPFIDTGYFPNTYAGTYLTGTEVANASSSESTQVWGVDFGQGVTDSAIDNTSDGYRARAVCVASTN